MGDAQPEGVGRSTVRSGGSSLGVRTDALGPGEAATASSDGRESEGEEIPDFFDPDIDDQDAEWVVQQRQGRRTDAILSCPCCLTTCCIDCQRHEGIPSQYRAMFVTNCRVDLESRLLIPLERQGARKRRREATQREPDSANSAPGDLFHPVHCSLCDARLGVCDAEEVFHFTDVIASEA